MSDTAIVAICSAVASVLISIFTIVFTYLTNRSNNKHNKQIKETEIFYESKVNAYQEFMSVFGMYRADASWSNFQSLGEKSSNALLYANSEVRQQLLIILQFIASSPANHMPVQEIDKAYMKIVPLISEDLDATYKSINTKKSQIKSK